MSQNTLSDLQETYYQAAMGVLVKNISAVFTIHTSFITGKEVSNLSNSSYLENNKIENNFSVKKAFDNHRQFIKLEETFQEQLNNYPEIYSDLNAYVLKEKMKLSVDAILSCYPEKVSLEVTAEGSLFYTFLKDDLTVYFQHFLLEEFDDSDEAIVTIYKSDEKVLDFGGTLIEALQHVNLSIAHEPILMPEFV